MVHELALTLMTGAESIMLLLKMSGEVSNLEDIKTRWLEN
jgi:hypothetical protein